MKEKKPFKVGETIKFVGPITDNPNVFSWGGFRAKVLGVNELPESLDIECNPNGELLCGQISPRQVTHRIRKKPKPAEPKREERWVNIYPEGSSGFLEPRAWTKGHLAFAGKSNHEGYIRTAHLIELKEGERVVSREELAKAWEITFRPEVNGLAKNDICFKNFCKALGFPEERT